MGGWVGGWGWPGWWWCGEWVSCVVGLGHRHGQGKLWPDDFTFASLQRLHQLFAELQSSSSRGLLDLVPHPCLTPGPAAAAAGGAGDADHPGLSIAWGTCGHVFHLDCIQRWLKTRSACPLCNREWEFSKIERIVGGSANAE